ncbi:hypothetical protein KVT40_004616 [Elsinoe batatas]|uniref:DUF2470 domain-containing protein n=1 Tax=Elsinoe batatas TaxID=2601811 RepID=A0A8K0PH65_9PEZI|nr:hypothetical protein KVT40_004616 [Elsinoe batatas]
MDDQATKDAAAKQRIISHMNADHHDSVVRYLEHYHKQSSWSAYSARITDVTLSDITFQSDAGRFSTPLNPPMTSFREARERLVAMDKECVQALGRSDITIRDFETPYGWYLYLFIIVSATFVAFSRRANFAPNSLAAAIMPDVLRRFNYAIQPYLLFGLFAIHGTEAYVMANGRLKKHNVNMRTKTFWLWVGDAFIEGFGSFHRFDKIVKEKQAAKAQQKH